MFVYVFPRFLDDDGVTVRSAEPIVPPRRVNPRSRDLAKWRGGFGLRVSPLPLDDSMLRDASKQTDKKRYPL